MAAVTSRAILLGLLALALVPVAFVGGCLLLAGGAGVYNFRDDARERVAAAADPGLQRPLVSTSGRILFIAQKGGTDDFYVVNADGSGLTPVTQLPTGSMVSRAILSPDHTRIAVAVGGVLIVPIDRPGEALRLDRPGGSLAWSPDGRRLASLSVDDQKRLHLYLFNADGSGEVRDIAGAWPSTAAGDQQFAGDLTWAPDGTRVAFILATSPAFKRSGPRHRHLYIAPVDGSGLKNLSLDPKALSVQDGLAWSPDGRRLAFRSGQGVGTVDADLNWKEIPIAIHETRSSPRPAWSPDGTHLAWFSPNSIVISDPDGGRQQELTRGRCRGVHPSWSTDGLRIAFVCHESGSDLWVMNADGSGLTRITHLSTGSSVFDPAATYSLRDSVWLESKPSTTGAPSR